MASTHCEAPARAFIEVVRLTEAIVRVGARAWRAIQPCNGLIRIGFQVALQINQLRSSPIELSTANYIRMAQINLFKSFILEAIYISKEHIISIRKSDSWFMEITVLNGGI